MQFLYGRHFVCLIYTCISVENFFYLGNIDQEVASARSLEGSILKVGGLLMQFLD